MKLTQKNAKALRTIMVKLVTLKGKTRDPEARACLEQALVALTRITQAPIKHAAE